MATMAVAVVSTAANQLDIFALGANNAMCHRAFDQGAWNPAAGWDDLGGGFSSPPAVASWGGNRIDIFALGNSNEMFHMAWNGGAWVPPPGPWEPLNAPFPGGTFISWPAVVSCALNRLDVFAVGTNNAMYHLAWVDNKWAPATGWDNLGGGPFSSPPAVASWGVNRVDIFALGEDSDVQHMAWSGGAWPPQSGWETLGGTFSSPPAVASWAANRLDVFALGTHTAMYHIAWDGNAWTPAGWQNLNGLYDGPPAVASWAANRLDIFGPQPGIVNSMGHDAWRNGAWLPFTLLGTPFISGVFSSSPAVASWGENRLDIFAIATDNGMYHKAWDGAWLPSELGWDFLGGAFNIPPAPNPVTGISLGSNSNYYLYSNGEPITGLEVIIEITEDIVASNGFSFQLNAYSPTGFTCAGQQYVIAVDTSGNVYGAVDNWYFNPLGKLEQLLNSNYPNNTAPIYTLPSPTLPQGYKLCIQLSTDGKSRVWAVSFFIYDGLGNLVGEGGYTLIGLSVYGSSGTPVPEGYLAPIVAFEVDLVGYALSQTADLSSGQGNITCSASAPMAPTATVPPPGTQGSIYTTEHANSFYGVLSATPSATITQPFTSSTVLPMIRKVGKYGMIRS